MHLIHMIIILNVMSLLRKGHQFNACNTACTLTERSVRDRDHIKIFSTKYVDMTADRMLTLLVMSRNAVWAFPVHGIGVRCCSSFLSTFQRKSPRRSQAGNTDPSRSHCIHVAWQSCLPSFPQTEGFRLWGYHCCRQMCIGHRQTCLQSLREVCADLCK